MRLYSRVFLALACAVALWGPRDARADDEGVSLMLGYGQLYQNRLDVDSSGHLPFVGVRLNLDGVTLWADFQFSIDQEHEDPTQYAFTLGGQYEWNATYFGAYFGGGIRTGFDGYPEPSWSPFDPGVVAGFWFGASGVVQVGVEGRGWLGWHWYAPRNGGDAFNEVEPYVDWRVWLAFRIS